MNKNILKIVGVLVAVAVIAGGYVFPRVRELASASPQGSTFLQAKSAGVTVNLAAPGSNATSTSILNTDANARLITGLRLACTGVGSSKTAYTGAGLAALLLSVGTTTTAAPASFSSNVAIATNLTLSTSTANLLIASSTNMFSGAQNSIIWDAGKYLTFYTNATNTAVCTFSADYLGS